MTVPRNITHEDLQPGQTVRITYVYSPRREASEMGVVTRVLDLPEGGVRFGTDYFETVSQPDYDVTIELLDEAPAATPPLPDLAMVQREGKTPRLCIRRNYWQGEQWRDVETDEAVSTVAHPASKIERVLVVPASAIVFPVENGEVILDPDGGPLRLSVDAVADALSGGLGGHFFEAMGLKFDPTYGHSQ
jgi:hypothetical protein